ncbi:MAG TPA: L,D-transpeptidase family protein [Gemmatimonadaceae bacterium]|nr:L,D-transpeptidase family protein [Gemmatimonadaceae bacterium]
MMFTLKHLAAVRAVVLIAAASLGSACSTGGDAKQPEQTQVAKGEVARGGWAPAELSEVKGVPIAALRSAVQQRLAGSHPATVGEDAWKHTKNLYARFQQAPLWMSEDGLEKDRAGALTNAVLAASTDAVRIDDYPVAELAQAIADVRNTKQPTAEQLANADVLLTAAYASLGEDLLVGSVDPKSVGQAWHIDAKEENVDSALVRTLSMMPLDKSISAMRPGDEEYAAMQKELTRYRELVAKGGWQPVPAGKPLKRGQTDSPQRLAALRARLQAEGIDVASVPPASPAGSDTGTGARRSAASGSAVFDDGLAAAVAQFQARHGINVDSSLGTETLNSLNVPAAYRLGQIAANLERARWMPRSLGSRYIYVNVPAFHLSAFDAGKPTLEMKVIVGQEYEDKATPVFSDSMEFVVFRPYWNITPDIQAKEIGPKVASNPGYLAENDMEYYKDGGTTRIRQKPGPKNSLGFVKFLFPNDFNIYLHDTPNHELFDKDVRAFSHGCIRVEKPAELAQWVLGWDAAKVDEAMQNGKDNQQIKLPKKIPVYIAYGTTYMRDGQLYFGNDLYHRDDQLVKAIAEGALPSDRAVKALEALKRIATS